MRKRTTRAIVVCLADVTPRNATHAEKLQDRIATFVHRAATGEWSEQTACEMLAIAIGKYTLPRPEYAPPSADAVAQALAVIRAYTDRSDGGLNS